MTNLLLTFLKNTLIMKQSDLTNYYNFMNNKVVISANHIEISNYVDSDKMLVALLLFNISSLVNNLNNFTITCENYINVDYSNFIEICSYLD